MARPDTTDGWPSKRGRTAVSRSFAIALFGAVALVASTRAFAQSVRPEVVRVLPHDPQAFTQGLLLSDGKFYESTGLLGRSSLRRVNPATGAVEKAVPLSNDRFGEGLALVEGRLIQLTWRNEAALIYDLELAPVGNFEYEGEGWGLCFDGKRLVMSDGSSRLFFRDPKSFALLGQIEVRRAGVPVSALNELECVDNLVYANVWQTETLVRIDSASGNVLTTFDASGLLDPAEAAAADVLNGIAHDPKSQNFFITGKLWPKIFEVRLPAAIEGTTPPSGGSGGAGGSAGASGGSPAGDGGGSAPVPKGTPAASGSSSSCGCRVPASGAGSALLPAVFALVAFAASRRRRPRNGL